MFSLVSAPFFIKYAALHIIKPSTSIAADPVYAVKKNVRSSQSAPTARKNSKQNLQSTFIAMLLPAPTGTVRNMGS